MAKKKNALRIWIKRIIYTVVGLGFAGLVVVSVMPKPVQVDMREVEVGPLVDTVNETGRTRVMDRYIVSAPLAGSIARIEHHAGDSVEEGTVIARIVPITPALLDSRSRAQASARLEAARAAQRQSRASITRAQAALEYASTEAARQEQLASQGSVSERVREQANLELRSRQAELASSQFGSRVASYELRMAQAALGRLDDGDNEESMEVPAPVSGQILRLIQESEGVVQPGTPLMEIGDPTALEIVVDVLTTDAVEIEQGARVVIERWGGEIPLDGEVRLIEPSAFSRVSALGVEEQRVNVVIEITSPLELWSALGDGYGVETRIVVWEGEDVLYVPASSVFRHDGGWAVFAEREGRASLTPVGIGRRTGLEVQILEGLAAGDSVVLHPSDRVEDGVDIVAR